MFTRTTRLYRDAFSGLSSDIWLLSLVTLINRSGTMVIPFLTVYLTVQKEFSMGQAGFIMSIFGAGGLLGSYLGGWLTDRYSYYGTMFWSLFLGGAGFIGLSFAGSFSEIAVVVFLISIIGEAFRPATFAAVAAYSRAENRTRSFSLIRIAVNLGFSIGPALGGFLAANVGYGWLFWADGLTCIFAALVFRLILKPKTEEDEPSPLPTAAGAVSKPVHIPSPYRDRRFLFFMVTSLLVSVAFMQFFSTIPLFFKEVYRLDEDRIGALLAMNGLLIVFIEMALVYSLESRFPPLVPVGIGSLIIGASFGLFFIPGGLFWVAVAFVVGMTFGEMFNFPFSNVYVVNRSNRHNRGRYMGVYTMFFALTHIIAPTLGLQIVEHWGFSLLWKILGIGCLVAFAGQYHLFMLEKRTIPPPESIAPAAM